MSQSFVMPYPVPMITKRLEFDAGHRLMNHEGKCQYVHGHRWAVEITLSTKSGMLDNVGRVIDFGDVKKLLGGWIDEHLDHNMILCKDDVALIDNIKPFCKNGSPYIMADNPTSENLSLELYRVFVKLLFQDKYANLKLERIKLYETPTSCAEIF